MKRAQIGSIVSIRYIGTLDNGRIFHSTEGGEPLTFVIGEGQVFPALEQAVTGMKPGEVKNIVISAADAYGPRLEENVIVLERRMFPAGRDLASGQKLSIDFAGGQSRVMIITAVDEERVILDGNHPLAGLDLTFALKIDKVE